jgi:hypothetical protein
VAALLRHLIDVIMGYICTGSSFPELQVTRTTGGAKPETYFTMSMEGAFITKVSTNGTDDGSISQNVEMVFKTVLIDYKPQNSKSGKLGAAKTFAWDIPGNGLAVGLISRRAALRRLRCPSHKETHHEHPDENNGAHDHRQPVGRADDRA